MTKFKGSILSRKLEADQNLPTVPSGHHYGDHETGQLWSKPAFVASQANNIPVASKSGFYSTPTNDNDTEDESASSPIMDLTVSMNGGHAVNDAQQRHRASPVRHTPTVGGGFGESTTASDSNLAQQMLGQYNDNDAVRMAASKYPTNISGIVYRQPWENGHAGSHGQTNMAATAPIQHDQQISSPTSSAFTSNSDSTPSTLVLATLKKRKRKPQPIPDDCKDDAYWERRKRNNESAKRSREMRRVKEQQTTMRVIFLEQENLRLRTETDMLRTELEKLREILYSRNSFGNGV